MANNEKFRFLLKITFWLTPLLLGAALAFGGYREKISNMGPRLEAVEKKANDNELNLTSMGKDIEHIKQIVDRIDRKIDDR